MSRLRRLCVLAAAGLLTVAVLPALPASAAPASGSISGRVTSAASGRGLDGVDISALDGRGNYVAEATSAGGGSYTMTGLPPSTTGYVICASGHYRTGDGSPAGYAAVCYRNVPWLYPGIGLPPQATKVPVVAGVTRTGIDFAQPQLGGISGRVTGSATGAGLSGITVTADDGVRWTSQTTTGTDGRYFIAGLRPSMTGYTVCFIGAATRQAIAAGVGSDPAGKPIPGPGRSPAAALAPTTGADRPVAPASAAAVSPPLAPAVLSTAAKSHDNKCYQNVPYHVDAAYPPGTTPVAVRGGVVTAGIDAVLELQGGIAGRVTTPSGRGIAGLAVTVFDSGGHVPFTLPLQNVTASDGSYRVDGLDPASGYSVCFDGGAAYPSRCYRNAIWVGTQLGPPPGSTPVTVKPGATTTGVDSVWAAPGGISGRVTDAAGHGLSRVEVVVTEANGFTQIAFSDSTGRYLVTGLAASTAATVCFAADAGGTSAGGTVPRTGDASECYRDVPFSFGRSLPRGTTGVPVKVGTVTGGIDAALGLDGAISGTVLSAAGHLPLQVRVTAYDSAGQAAGSTDTTSTGTYFLDGLPRSDAGYRVCFATSYEAPGGNSTTGYAPLCYRNSSYLTTGAGTPGPGSTAVPVGAGRTSGGISVELHTAGVISGVVTAADGGGPLFDAGVTVFDRLGVPVQVGQTDEAGRYSISGLLASTAGYTLCFQETAFVGNPSPTGYQGRCYRNAAWNGGAPARGATRVPVTFGQTVTGVDVALPDAGILTGTVTDAATGAWVSGVTAVVFDSSRHRVTSTTVTGGRYTVSGLAPSKAGYTVCFDSSKAATHYAGSCYRNVSWRPTCPPPPGVVPVPVALGTVTTLFAVALRT